MRSGLLGEGKLLDARGVLCEGGYAFSQVKDYARKAVKGGKLRIKEWDYYYFGDDKYAIALTVADNSYMSLASASVIDYPHLRYITKSKIGLFPKGKLRMPSDCSSGDVSFEKRGVQIKFSIAADGARRLTCRYEKFDGKRDFECELNLEPISGDNITVAVPFKKKKQFYYNTKVNCLRGRGEFSIGDESHKFENGFGGLDWGRGVWPYRNRWFWSSLSCEVEDVPFGLNLGYGFGKPIASENVIFYDGKAHKIDDVKFEIPYTQGKLDYLKPWKITDDKQRLELLFYPMIDRADRMNAVVLSTNQHQVFGKFYGKATLDDGKIVAVSDKLGFAEHVVNKW